MRFDGVVHWNLFAHKSWDQIAWTAFVDEEVIIWRLECKSVSCMPPFAGKGMGCPPRLWPVPSQDASTIFHQQTSFFPDKQVHRFDQAISCNSIGRFVILSSFALCNHVLAIFKRSISHALFCPKASCPLRLSSVCCIYCLYTVEGKPPAATKAFPFFGSGHIFFGFWVSGALLSDHSAFLPISLVVFSPLSLGIAVFSASSSPSRQWRLTMDCNNFNFFSCPAFIFSFLSWFTFQLKVFRLLVSD